MSRYKIKKFDKDNEYIGYPGATTVLGQLDKSDGLIPWAVNCACKYIEINHKTESFKNVISNAKKEWRTVKDDTADIGKEVHRLIEIHIKFRIEGKNKIVTHENPFVTQMFFQFLVWEKHNVKRWIESEMTVCHRSLCYAGTCDAIYINQENEVCLLDFKTTSYKPYRYSNGKMNYKLKKCYVEHKIQVAAYKLARESMSGKYDIHFEQDDHSWHKVIEYKSMKIDRIQILDIERDFFNVIHTDCTKDYDNFIVTFQGLLIVYYSMTKRRLNNIRAELRR